VEGICRIVFKDNIKGEIFNLGNPEEVKVIDLAKKIIQLTNSKSHIVFVKASEDEPKRRCPDISKAKAILDWQPKVSLEEGLIKQLSILGERRSFSRIGDANGELRTCFCNNASLQCGEVGC